MRRKGCGRWWVGIEDSGWSFPQHGKGLVSSISTGYGFGFRGGSIEGRERAEVEFKRGRVGESYAVV